jgi:hypothetical protein
MQPALLLNDRGITKKSLDAVDSLHRMQAQGGSKTVEFDSRSASYNAGMALLLSMAYAGANSGREKLEGVKFSHPHGDRIPSRITLPIDDSPAGHETVEKMKTQLLVMREQAMGLLGDTVNKTQMAKKGGIEYCMIPFSNHTSATEAKKLLSTFGMAHGYPTACYDQIMPMNVGSNRYAVLFDPHAYESIITREGLTTTGATRLASDRIPVKAVKAPEPGLFAQVRDILTMPDASLAAPGNRQVIKIHAATDQGNVAVGTLLLFVYSHMPGDRKNFSETTTPDQRQQHIIQMEFDVPDGAEKFPARSMREQLGRVQRVLINELQDVRYTTRDIQPGNEYYILPQDSPLHARNKWDLLANMLAAYGLDPVKEMAIGDARLGADAKPTPAVFITAKAYEAILGHEQVMAVEKAG